MCLKILKKAISFLLATDVPQEKVKEWLKLLRYVGHGADANVVRKLYSFVQYEMGRTAVEVFSMWM